METDNVNTTINRNFTTKNYEGIESIKMTGAIKLYKVMKFSRNFFKSTRVCVTFYLTFLLSKLSK